MKPYWEFLLSEASFASVLPPQFVNFARPIRDALSQFLGGLPESQQASILLAQGKLSPAASFSQRLGLLAQSSPVLQKLGQILARDRRLPLELRKHLSALESLSPTVPQETIERSLTQELGSLDRLGIRLEPAIAEASVAVVVPYQQGPGTNEKAAAGVFKVLKPGIEDQLDRELRLLESVGEYLDQRCEDLRIPHLAYEESFQLARLKLLDEVQLGHEQSHLVEAKKFYADDFRVHIPELREHCTSRVTAMERLTGGQVTALTSDSICERQRVASLVAEALIAKPIFSKSDQPLFHGDPHAGNLFLTDDGRLGILDWSLAGKLGVREREAIVQTVLAAITLDAQRIVSVLMRLDNQQRIDKSVLRAVAETWIRRVRWGRFPDLAWLVGMLDEAVHKAGWRASAELMLFRKSLLTLEGVVADVGQCTGLIQRTMTLGFLQHFAAESPERWFSPPNSRAFATRLSNLDLLQTVLSGPTMATRFWMGHTFDMLEACARSG